MSDKKAFNNFFNQIFQLWVNPELEERKTKGSLSPGFCINTCLILLPKNKSPIVKFNDEIHWLASAKKPKGLAFKKGQSIYLHEIEGINTVELPSIDGKPVAFIYFHRIGKDEFSLFFDFSPNHPEGSISKTKEMKEIFSKEIAKSLQELLINKTLSVHDSVQTQLQKIGLWAVPALLPYPMSKIIFSLANDDIETAKKTLLDYCTPDFLEKRIADWWSIAEFEKRRTIIESALGAHNKGVYVLSIPALLPLLEGIITDWVFTQLPPEMIPWRLDSKTKRFRDIALERITPFSYCHIINSAIDFILRGPVLQTFKCWVDDIEKAFPNRHVVEHGKFDPDLFTEENSLKLFLLLDTFWYIISWHSEDRFQTHNQ